MARRQTTRIYSIDAERYVQITKEWSMKFGQNLYYVTAYPSDGKTLLKAPSFKEARQFVLDLVTGAA